MIKKFTGMLSKIAIILVVFYFAAFLFVSQARAIEYPLPNPGILPDSPVYFLKVARDQTILWFIKDPLQKAFYLLFLSDKRLAAGGISVVKAEDYFKQAVDQGVIAKKSGKDTTDLFSKFVVSSAKHEEIINSLLTKTSGKESEQLLKAHRDNLNSKERVREIFFQAVGFSK